MRLVKNLLVFQCDGLQVREQLLHFPRRQGSEDSVPGLIYGVC